MAYRVSRKSLTAALTHLCRYGDTDIFPHLPELAFFVEEQEAIVAELSKLDLDSYTPIGATEALAPKSRYGFRIAHQLPALDTLLFLASVVEIGGKIEAKRQSKTSARAFSYRFAVDTRIGQLFRPGGTYKDWLHRQQKLLANPKFRRVISTDVSDYYSRINFHRLENLLDEAAPGHGAVRFIKKHIEIIRAKQSFGLPVGGAAARLLAELALSDIDQALADHGLFVTRFVDDFRLFLRSTDNPYDALGYLAEQLGITEGLSLNNAKTSVLERGEYLQQLNRMTSDISDEAEGIALEALTADIYFDDNPDEEDVEKLRGLNLVEWLAREIARKEWDMGRIKVLFRAIKIAKPEDAHDFITCHFSELAVFAKEVCLLMETLEDDKPGCFDSMLDELIAVVLSPPASSVQVIRTWLLEILVRGIVNIPRRRVRELEALPEVANKRQLLLIRSREKDTSFFRKQKTATHNFSAPELSCLVWGASCLPRDEYKNWINAVKRSFKKPLDKLYLEWASRNKDSLISKLKRTTLDHPN